VPCMSHGQNLKEDNMAKDDEAPIDNADLTEIGSDIAAAWDSLETEETPDGGRDETVPDSDSGRAADTGGDTPPGSAPPDDSGVPGNPEPDKPASESDLPPVSLPPEAREVWKETPPAMKAAIARREADYAKGIEKYRENAQRAQQMDQAIMPFQQYLAMQGTPPGQTIHTLLQTASSLQMGSPAQKAQTVAQLISQFGVDIATLDSLLAGEDVPRGTQLPPEIQQKMDRFDQYLAMQEQREQYERQQTQGRIGNELQEFAKKNEFYNDVAADMADFLDVASRNGRNMTLDEAYQRACMAHPSISQIMTTRSKAPTPTQKAAASTLRGNGMGTDTTGEPDTLRDAIEAAWANQGRM
jgi:hypothetical protein